MSLEEMERRGMLLPREQWDRPAPRRHKAWPDILAMGMQIAAVVFAYVGGGGPWTWASLAVFLVALGAYTVISVRAGGRALDQPP